MTVFLGNVVMYFAFLLLFAYTLLVDFRPPPQGPSGPEVLLSFWVFTLVLEEIRQVSGGPAPALARHSWPGVGGAISEAGARAVAVDPLAFYQGFFTDEDTHLLKKLTLYVEDNWNKCDMMAIFLFAGGVTCRSGGLKALQEQRQAGWGQGHLQNGARGPRSPGFPAPGPCVPGSPPPPRAPATVLPQDAALGVRGRPRHPRARLHGVHAAAHPHLRHPQAAGPQDHRRGADGEPHRGWGRGWRDTAPSRQRLMALSLPRQMKDIFFFLFFLSVWLLAYGVTTQALLHPHDSRLEWIFRRVLYRPYLQIFGQIPLDEIDGQRRAGLGGLCITE